LAWRHVSGQVWRDFEWLKADSLASSTERRVLAEAV
jgi:hypothetical protein